MTTLCLAIPTIAAAQTPIRHWTDAIDSRFTVSAPAISYTLTVDSADLSGFAVRMDLRGQRDTVLLAMATHPEYDDRYWRYVRDFRVEAPNASPTITRADSALWRVVAPGGAFTVRYRLALPSSDARFRPGWRPFLAPGGGLVGGTQSFMYVVGQTLAPSRVTLAIPRSWKIATGLAPTSEPRTFYAPSALVLLESPMLVGTLREWRFVVNDVPHRIVYWPNPDAAPFDTAALVRGVEGVVRGAASLFGQLPYREYVFQLHDGALGALEHPNSLSLGAPSQSLARGVEPLLEEIAHEYFHAFNLMRIHPVEYGDVTYETPRRSRGLWFSEGLTMFYADVLMRRAGIPTDEATRLEHLQALISRYLATPGNYKISPERVSEAEYGGAQGALGDHTASPHLQGELIGTMLDLEIRHATSGRKSMDDVMRLMLARYSGQRGFTSADVERVVAEMCGCSVARFFEQHVRGANPIDFNAYLRHAGLKADVAWRPALGPDGRPVADLRAYPYDAGDGGAPRIALTTPESAWGRAGLHTGDRILAMNGTPVTTPDSIRARFRTLRSGDTVTVEVQQTDARRTVHVIMAPFDRPFVTISELPNATSAQRSLRARWQSSQP
jgi:predicted metalloprotease with PDZ domain